MSTEYTKYKNISEQLRKITSYNRPKNKAKTPVAPKKNLSFLSNLAGIPKAPSLPEYRDVVKEVIVKETPPEILQKLEELENRDTEVDVKKITEAVIQALKELKGNDRLDISNIRNGEQLAQAASKKASGGFDMNDLRWHGSGGASGTSSVTYSTDLSAQCNGVNKVFTVPTNTAFILLTGTDSPQIYRPIVDYTGSGTTTLTLDAGVNAPSLGATLILTYKVT